MDTPTTRRNRKSILVTGGSGFIGTELVQVLIGLDHDVTVLIRRQTAATRALDGEVSFITDLAELGDDTVLDVIINLAGEPLAKGRWTKKRKAGFLSSRLAVTANLCVLVARLIKKPEVFISGSAIGYYGPHQDAVLDESGEVVAGFSHELCRRWETQALEAETPETRVCLLRIGIVLGRDGGPLSELRLPFDSGISMQIATGRQWMSWIHLDDLIGMILFIMNTTSITGAVNGTAPVPVTNRAFADSLSARIKTFVRVRVPGKLLRLMVGEMADEVLVTGQRVIPAKMQNEGFVFTYPRLGTALDDLIGSVVE